MIADQDEELWGSGEETSDEEEVEEHISEAQNVGSTSLQRIIYRSSRGNSLTEEEIMQIQLQRQSRTVNFGVGKNFCVLFYF